MLYENIYYICDIKYYTLYIKYDILNTKYQILNIINNKEYIILYDMCVRVL
jgi:hypothetical protein